MDLQSETNLTFLKDHTKFYRLHVIHWIRKIVCIEFDIYRSTAASSCLCKDFIKDFSGVSRPFPLYIALPMQIKFSVPVHLSAVHNLQEE